MGAIFEDHEFRSLDTLLQHFSILRSDLIVSAVGYEGWRFDVPKFVRYIPVPDRSDRKKFIRSPHELVHGSRKSSSLLLHHGLDRWWPGIQPAEMSLVDLVHCPKIFIVLIIALSFILAQSFLQLLGELRSQAPHLSGTERSTGTSAGDKKALQI